MNELWREDALDLISEHLYHDLKTATGEDIREWLIKIGLPAPNPRLYSGMIRQAIAENLIRPTAAVRSPIHGSHKRDLRVYSVVKSF